MAKGKKTGGRTKGTPNRVSGDVRAMVLEALDLAGGTQYLVVQARDSPQAFMGLLGKTMPRDVKLEVRASLEALIASVDKPKL